MSLLECAIRNLVRVAPHNVYTQVNGISHYESGQCTDGSVGCLIGQGIKQLLGYMPPNPDDMCLSELVAVADFSAVDDEQWFYDLQGAQDEGLTWHEALKIADNPETPE